MNERECIEKLKRITEKIGGPGPSWLAVESRSAL